jgi:hypothetical protein
VWPLPLTASWWHGTVTARTLARALAASGSVGHGQARDRTGRHDRRVTKLAEVHSPPQGDFGCSVALAARARATVTRTSRPAPAGMHWPLPGSPGRLACTVAPPVATASGSSHWHAAMSSDSLRVTASGSGIEGRPLWHLAMAPGTSSSESRTLRILFPSPATA